MYKLFLLLMLSVALPGVAQTNFQPGYILPLEGDTLRGEVDFRSGRRNTRQCRFRSGEQVTDYRPGQLRGYGFAGGKVYESVVAPEADSLPQAVFMEVLVLGPASLYYFHDRGNAERYFLRVEDKPLLELVQLTVEAEVNQRTYRQKQDVFRQPMGVALQACPSLEPEIARVRFAPNELAEVVRRYNACVGQTSVAPLAAQRRERVRLALVAGAQRSRVVFVGSGPVREGEHGSNIGTVLGLGLTWQPSRLNRNLALRVELMHENQRYQGVTPVSNDLYVVEEEFRARLASIRLPVLLRYAFPKGRVRPYGQVGFTGAYMLSTQNEVRQYYGQLAPNVPSSPWRPGLEGERRWEAGFAAGIGLKTSRTNGRDLALELRFERSNGLSNYTGFGMHLNRWFLLASYDLTK